MTIFVQIAICWLFCSIDVSCADTYEGYKIYDITTKNYFEKEVLSHLSKDTEYDFLDLPKSLDEAARVMVAPKDQNEFETALRLSGIEFVVVDGNVGQTAELKREENQAFDIVLDAAEPNINFARFHRYNHIYAYLDRLADDYPRRVTVKTLGKSYEQRNLKAVTISNGDGRTTDKKVILLDAGIHAREWIAPAAALYVIHQLVENFDDNSDVLNDYDWIIVPLVNPDGYEYAHTRSRMWRKTRKPVNSVCCGTDGNRNFGYYWGGAGASSYSCSNIFKGSKAFSEPETQVMRDLMHSLSGRAKMYLSLHSYGNRLLYPWSHTSTLPSTWREMHEVASAGATAIRSATGTRYKVGSTTHVLYAASGGSHDYAFGVANITISITMELPAGGSGFDPRPFQIEPFVSESWIGIKAMAEKVIAKY